MKKSIFRNIKNTVKENLFKDLEETIWVYLRATNTKGNAYDPYRQTGFTTTLQNPLPVKAMIRQLSSNSLIMRELGLAETGAIEIIVQEKDVNLFKICDKIQYNSIEFVTYREALGNRIQITNTQFGFSKIILFPRGN
jgi:predicted RNA-binding protein associated with RNAse of E/G family